MKNALTAALVLATASSAWAQTQYTGSGNPTAAEQLVLEIINRARANPTAEGTRLSTTAVSGNPSLTNGLSAGIPGGNIAEGLVAPDNVVGARPPLAMNAILRSSAQSHCNDLYNNDLFQHNSSNGTIFSTRIKNAGYNWQVPGGMVGENIAYAGGSAPGVHGTAEQLENILMIDEGIGGRGHRVNLLNTHDPPYFREIGIFYLHHDTPTATKQMTDLVTQDFGTIPANGPFILGVVFDDNGNNFYDIGEGLSGVTVRLNPPGAFYAVTGTAGGYAFPYSGGGSVIVEATGGVFGTGVATKVVALTGENIKVDFKPSDLTDSDTDGLTDAWEMAHFGNLLQTATDDPDGDTFTNLQEMNAGTDPLNSSSVPSSGGGGGGGCGLTGLEAFLAMALLRVRRRR